MNIREVLNLASRKLQNRPEEILAIELLLAFCIDKDREFLFAHPEAEVGPDAEARFRSLFERFYSGEPVAYLTNRKEFYGLDFYVDKRVLIPRPETEMLVDKVLDAARSVSGEMKILDVGTGSGCIAIAIAKNLPKAKVVGVDISTEALEVATGNALKHGVADRVSFCKSDLLVDIKDSFDIVVANLPYIGKEKYNFVSSEAVDYEPHVALFGGDNGLFLYEELFKQLGTQKWKPKLLLGEFGFLQGEELRDLFHKYFPAEKWSIIKDLASIERVFMIGFAP